MTDLPTLRALESRLEKASGPDREIDAALWLALTPGATRRTLHVDHWQRPYDIDETRDETGRLIIVPTYTASLDAAIALCERVLPGWGIEVLTSDREMWRAQVWRWGSETNDERGQWTPCYAPAPALALCIAIVKALIAQQERKPHD